MLQGFPVVGLRRVHLWGPRAGLLELELEFDGGGRAVVEEAVLLFGGEGLEVVDWGVCGEFGNVAETGVRVADGCSGWDSRRCFWRREEFSKRAEQFADVHV